MDPPRIICLTIIDFQIASNRVCVTVIVTISPPNFFDPVFVTDSVMVTLMATDTRPQATITYSITQVVSSFMNTPPLFTIDLFTIITSEGNITAPNGLDTESYMRHTITVQAPNMGNRYCHYHCQCNRCKQCITIFY